MKRNDSDDFLMAAVILAGTLIMVGDWLWKSIIQKDGYYLLIFDLCHTFYAQGVDLVGQNSVVT